MLLGVTISTPPTTPCNAKQEPSTIIIFLKKPINPEVAPSVYHAIGEVLAAHLDEFNGGGAVVLRVRGQLPADGLAVGSAVLTEDQTTPSQSKLLTVHKTDLQRRNTHGWRVVGEAIGEGGILVLLLRLVAVRNEQLL